MARGNKQIPGQMTIEMCIDQDNYVVQANELIGGRQALGLNSAKLIRTAVMQIRPEDREIKPYLITIKQLAELLGITPDNFYRVTAEKGNEKIHYIDEITDDIVNNPVFIKKNENKRIQWVKIPWVEYCQYDSDVGVTIQLNQRLKPFLIALKEHYTQYRLENILAMKSIYAIRIFEMLQAKIMTRLLPREGRHIILTLDEIGDGCDLSDKYKDKETGKWVFGNLNNRVIKIAVKEINRVTTYKLEYEKIKNGRTVEAIDFLLNMQYH